MADSHARCLRAAGDSTQTAASLDELAAALNRLGMSRTAVEIYQLASRRFPDNTALLRGLIRARADARHRESLQGARRENDSAGCFDQRGTTALETCRQAIARAPTAELHARLGAVYRGLGAPALALESYSRALAIHPDRGDWQRQRAALRQIAPANLLGAAPPDAGPLAAPVQEALIVGNDRYQHFPELASATRDAETLATLLRTRFAMKVTLLRNATRGEILGELAAAGRRLRVKDDLLIYYAGHGIMDDAAEGGYWLPVDAEPRNPANWVSTSDVNAALRRVPAGRALVIADSCYAGALLQPEDARGDHGGKRHRTRLAITSGYLEPVLDEGAGKHSVFANALLAALEGVQHPTTSTRLFETVERYLSPSAEQTPRHGALPAAGHVSGDFTFAPLPDHDVREH